MNVDVCQNYQMSIYLRMTWVDPRLEFSENVDHVLVSAKNIDQIWKPDLFFPNEEKADFHVVTLPNKLLRVYGNGTVLYSLRYV